MSLGKILRAAKSGSAAFCLSLFLLVQAMATAPSLHAWLHQDAGETNHECAVTLFLHGQVHTPTTEVEVTRCAPLADFPAPARLVPFVSADVRLLPSRGPPA